NYPPLIAKVLAARATHQFAVVFHVLEAPALREPRPPLPRRWPSWVTAVTGLGVALALAELVAFVAATILDQENREGGIIVDAIVTVAAGLQTVAWIALARGRDWAPVFALVTSALLSVVTFGFGLLVAIPVWWAVLRRSQAR